MQRSMLATFASSLRPEDPEFPHPKGYGLALVIARGLRSQEIAEVDVENWRDVGWSIDCVIDQHRVYMFVSHIGEAPRQWALCCTSDLGIVGRLLGRKDDAQVAALAAAVDRVLHGDARMSDVRWYPDGWRSAGDEPWEPHPRRANG
jgi:hypothetical protein